jgi:hypothetical protein
MVFSTSLRSRFVARFSSAEPNSPIFFNALEEMADSASRSLLGVRKRTAAFSSFGDGRERLVHGLQLAYRILK